MKRIPLIERHSGSIRLNHWAIVILFAGAALSGLSLFHPSLAGLMVLFGSGEWTRVLHPFFGVAMVLLFAVLFGRALRELLWRRHDTAWMWKLPHLFLTANDEAMPAAGRLNAGQKLVVWGFAASLATLLATGIVIWQPWFAGYFAIPLARIAVVLHAMAAVMLILFVMGHLYFAIWVRGSIRAMMRGTVSESWARQHHGLWFAEQRQRKDGVRQ